MKEKKTARFLAAILAVIMTGVLTLGMAACEERSETPSGDTPPASDTEDITKPSEVKGKDILKDEIKLLYSPIGDAGPAYEMAKYAIKDALKFLPNITVDIKPSEYDPSKQADIVQEGVNQGYDGIFLEAMDPNVSKQPIENAESKGIPVITINLNSNAVHTLFIQGQDYKSGQEAARILGAAINGKGNAVTLNAPAEQAATSQMIPGFNDAIKAEFPDITILEDFPIPGWQADAANASMADALTKYDKIDIVYAASDDLADGAIKAIQAAGREDEIKVYGAMGYPAALQRIKDGTQFGSYFFDFYGQFQTVIYQMLFFVENGISAQSLGLTATPLLDQPTTPITKDGKITGSMDVQTVIDISRWKLVMPDAFK